jgi:hypothetical protein
MRHTTMPVVLGMMVSILSAAVVTTAQTPAGDEQNAFRFQFAETASHRRLAVEGSIFNGLPWTITDVRVQVECVDGEGTVTSSSVGWVLGTVRAGDRGYFYVPVASRAAAYRVTVQSFNKIARETPQQSP